MSLHDFKAESGDHSVAPVAGCAEREETKAAFIPYKPRITRRPPVPPARGLLSLSSQPWCGGRRPATAKAGGERRPLEDVISNPAWFQGSLRHPQSPRSHQSSSRLGAVRTARPCARDPRRGPFGVLWVTEDEPCSEVTASRRTQGWRCRKVAVSWSPPGWTNITATRFRALRAVPHPGGHRGGEPGQTRLHPSPSLPA